MIRYFQFLLHDLASRWNAFWFDLPLRNPLHWTRILIAIASIFFVANWWQQAGDWIGPEGVFNLKVARSLASLEPSTGWSPWFGSFRWSLLYWTESEVFLRLYPAVLIILNIALLMGIGGRWVAGLVFLGTLGLVQRVPYWNGPAESLLMACLAYLVVHPGKVTRPFRPGLSDDQPTTSSTLGLRCMQCHYYAWLGMSFFSMQAGLIWWQGEAAWWLVATGRSWLFTMDDLIERSWLVNGLTHSIVVMQAIALIALPSRRWRPIGWLASVLFWVLVAAVSSEWMYAMIGLAASSCFFTTPNSAMGCPSLSSTIAYPAK